MRDFLAAALLSIALIACSKNKPDPTPIDPPIPAPPAAPDTLGAGWSKISFIPGVEINDIFFSDPFLGYVTTNQGVFKSTDGGVSFVKVRSELNFINIAANGQRAIFVGEPDSIVSTLNGTVFQKKGYSIPGTTGPVNFADVYFSSSNIAYAVSAKYMWKSVDGGANFATVFQFANISQPASLFFLNDNVGWIYRADGIYKTNDGGSSWTQVESSAYFGGTVFFTDPNVGYRTEVENSRVQVRKTTSAGFFLQTVFQSSVVPALLSYPDLHFVNSQVGYCTFGNRVYRTADAGSSWTLSAALGSGLLMEVHFLPTGVGWACGLNGSVYKYTP